MLNLGAAALQRVRHQFARWFHQFGIHCASHQIRIILISNVVITSLLYPALAIYSPTFTKSQLFPDTTSRIFDTFLAANAVSGFYAEHHLENVWTGYDTIRVHDDPIARALCASNSHRILRVERALLHTVVGPSDEFILPVLDKALHLERRIGEILKYRRVRCLANKSGRCSVLSPLLFWDHDMKRVNEDPNTLQTILSPKNASLNGITITPNMVVAGRNTVDGELQDPDSPLFLALTYFFVDNDCVSKAGHEAWIQLVTEASGSEPITEKQDPTILALSFHTDPNKREGWSAITAFLYLSYTGFFAYVLWGMSSMKGVHSAIGLTVTALVEISVSTITSLSVCAIVGFRVTMVPRGFLPIVLMFVGAEHMFNLVDTVYKTSPTLTVKQRIAEGLSRAGTSNTLKTISYNAILGVIAVFAVGVIRQFCVFAIVVLVAHWFLAHTFFMAVLSIDVQRLELDELLRHNTSLAPKVQTSPTTTRVAPSKRTWKSMALKGQTVLRGRATKNLSLLLLLAITAALYYTTYLAPLREKTDKVPSPFSTVVGTPNNNLTKESAAARRIWQFLNPSDDPLLHLRLEMPIILPLESSAERVAQMQSTRTSIHLLRTAASIIYVVVLPIAISTFSLYLVLRYLLKNAELLEAQRNKSQDRQSFDETDSELRERVSFTTLSRIFSADVEIIASSAHGRIVAAVSAHNELAVWRLDKGTHNTLEAANSILRIPSSASTKDDIVALDVDPRGQFLAVGTRKGIVAVWSIHDTHIAPWRHQFKTESASSVVSLQFITEASANGTPSRTTSMTSSPMVLSAATSLSATYSDGIAACWAFSKDANPAFLSPIVVPGPCKCFLLEVQERRATFIGLAGSNGALEIRAVGQGGQNILSRTSVLTAGNPNDVVSLVDTCSALLCGEQRLVVAAVTEAGVISLWDSVSSTCIFVFEEAHGSVHGLHVSSINRERCLFCGELPLESVSLSFSVGSVVLFYRICLPSEERHCTCTTGQSRRTPSWDHLGRRSRSGSGASSGTVTPTRRMSTIDGTLSALNEAAFPVSGHGFHSRRTSEKDTSRRPENLFVGEDNDSDRTVGPMSTNGLAALETWPNVYATMVGDATCERGTWRTFGSKAFGIRRRARTPVNGLAANLPPLLLISQLAEGLPAASLDRWELWCFDLASSSIHSSPLALLQERISKEDKAKMSRSLISRHPRLPFTRVRPFVGGALHGLAGFGNTIGVFKFTAA